MAESARLCASVALAAYAESLVDGGRVIVFGDASSSLPERLVERGARLVHVYDVDPVRVAEATTRNTSRSIAFAPLSEGGLAVREASFDLAVVENLAEGGGPDLLRRVARVLSARGVALIAAPNPEISTPLLPGGRADDRLDYYGLYDAAAGYFEHVRMLGQTPFVGYAVVDFAQTDEPEPSVDAGFVPGGAEDPEWFVALASQHELTLEQFTIIQLPLHEAWDTNNPAELREQLAAARAAERQARDRMAQLESSQLEAGRRRRERPADDGELGRLKKQLAKRDQWLEKLEERATTADARADEAQAELERLEERLAHAEEQREELSRLVGEERARVEESERNARDARRAKALDHQVRDLEAQLAKLAGIERDAAADVERLEKQLAERGEEIQRLETSLREASRAGRTLLLRLEDLEAGASEDVVAEQPEKAASAGPNDDAQPGARPRARDAVADQNDLETMTSALARQEANLAAAEWTITRLLSQLEATSGPEVAGLMRQLHEAQSKLQQQAVLIQQKLTSQSETAGASPPEAQEPDR